MRPVDGEDLDRGWGTNLENLRVVEPEVLLEAGGRGVAESEEELNEFRIEEGFVMEAVLGKCRAPNIVLHVFPVDPTGFEASKPPKVDVRGIG